MAVVETEEIKAIVLAGAGELMGEDSPYERGRRALRNEYSPILAASAELTKIESAEEAEKAVEFGRLLQNGSKETERYFKEIKLQIDAIKKPVLDAQKIDMGVIDTEKNRLSRLLTVYREKVEAQRRERERIAREEQEARDKAERERLAQIAREEQIARAIEAEQVGDIEAAHEILDEETIVDVPVSAPSAIQASAPTRFAGSSLKVTYTALVIGWEGKMSEKPETHAGWRNFRKLVEAVAAGKAPLRALLPNESYIATQGSNDKEGFSMPGCEYKRSTGTSFRR